MNVANILVKLIMIDLIFYQGAKAVSVLSEGKSARVFRAGGGIVAERASGRTGGVSFYAVDVSQTLVSAQSSDQVFRANFSPFGSHQIGDTEWPLAMYVGECFDDNCQGYILGAGYRLYKPHLMRLCSPDELSPFDDGGINPYAYCGGDPINYHDPSGRTRWPNIDAALGRWLGKARKNIIQARALDRVARGMRGGVDGVSQSIKKQIHQRARDIFAEQKKDISNLNPDQIEGYYKANPTSLYAIDYHSRQAARNVLVSGEVVPGNLGMKPVDVTFVALVLGSGDEEFKMGAINAYGLQIETMKKGIFPIADNPIDVAFDLVNGRGSLMRHISAALRRRF